MSGNNLPALIEPEQSKTLMIMADKFFASGMFPNIKNSAGAFAVVQYGRELGIPPMTSMQTMAIVKGKITMMGAMLQTLLIRGGVKIIIVKSTKEGCTLRFEREGYPTIETSFTEEDAKRAGLYKEDSGYVKYPEEMYYWRAMAKGGRRIGSDLMLGIYAKEEIQDDDSIIDVTAKEMSQENKRFDPRAHKQAVAEQTETPVAPPVNTGSDNPPEIKQDSNNQNKVEDQVVEIPNVVQADDEILLTPEEVKTTLEDSIDPAQELFEKLMQAIKEVETSGNKFRWKNWLKKHMPEINELKTKNEALWQEIAKYVAFMNTKKFGK